MPKVVEAEADLILELEIILRVFLTGSIQKIRRKNFRMETLIYIPQKARFTFRNFSISLTQIMIKSFSLERFTKHWVRLIQNVVMVRFTELSENLMKTMMVRSILKNSSKWSNQSKMEVLTIMTQMRKQKGSSKIQKI